MSLLDVISSIWSIRIKALLLAVVCAVVIITITFRVSLSPFRLTPRALQFAVAHTDVLVQAGQTPLANPEIPTSTVANLAANYAELINTPQIIGSIARSVGTSPTAIGVDEQLAQNVPLAQSNSREQQVGMQILDSRKRYEVLVRNDTGSFIVQIYTQAPTAEQARRMANATAQALRSYAASLAESEGAPLTFGVRLEQLGGATGGIVDRGASRDAAIIGGIGLWVAGIIALLTIRRLRERRAMASMAGQANAAPVSPGP